MGFQVSPGVNVTEKDLTLIVPAIATTNAGMAGAFQWGPVGERVLIDSENNLRQVFGDPNDDTFNWFFTAANFLGYGNNLQVVRAVGGQASNAATHRTAGGSDAAFGATAQIQSRTHFEAGASGAYPTAEFIGKYPGELGNSLRVVIMDDNGRTGAKPGGSGYDLALFKQLSLGDKGITFGFQGGAANYDFLAGDRIYFSDGQVVTVTDDVQDITLAGDGDGSRELKFSPGIYKALAAGTTLEIESRYAGVFASVPSTSQSATDAGGTNDEMNIAIIDGDGKWTGNKGEVLEIFEGVSKATNAVGIQGENIYYKDVINDRSRYVWARATVAGPGTGDKNVNFPAITRGAVAAAGGLTSGYTSPVGNAIRVLGLSGGIDANAYDGTTMDDGDVFTAFREFEDSETVDVSLLLGGAATSTVQGLLVDICDKRKDCIAFLSPVASASDPADFVQDRTAEEATRSVIDWRNNTLNKSSSYAVLDSGFKVQLDRYNDVLRHVPLNGDIAGLCARTEREQEAWFSPAGFNRGQIRGVVKLDLNPRQAHRDELYKNGINPVVAFPGEGTVLYGDKTLQSKPSAFDRINVRRLFIILEKAIATASKFLLFEFNDEFTRAQFRNMVIPFLRTVQSRRGIFDFKVVCDETNNTADIIDRNEFVGDIFIKPARSINYIQLNFIATPTGVDFSEIGA